MPTEEELDAQRLAYMEAWAAAALRLDLAKARAKARYQGQLANAADEFAIDIERAARKYQ